MPIKFFAVPALEPGEIEDELDKFVRSHRTVSIERKLVTVGERPVWCLAVEYGERVALEPADCSSVQHERSLALQQLFGGEADVAGDLAEQSGGDVATRVERHRRAATVGVSVLAMRSALANFLEAETYE